MRQTTKTDREIYQETHDLLAKGWIKGESYRDGKYCFEGALYKAITGKIPYRVFRVMHEIELMQNMPVIAKLVRHIEQLGDVCPSSANRTGILWRFNDVYSKTVDPILEVLKHMIAKEEEMEVQEERITALV